MDIDKRYMGYLSVPMSFGSLALQGPLLNLHLGSFSFSSAASVRGISENDVVFRLVEEILQDGFITQGDPILVTQPADLLAEAEDYVVSLFFAF